MKNRVEQIFQANEFRADDHDPKIIVHFIKYFCIFNLQFYNLNNRTSILLLFLVSALAFRILQNYLYLSLNLQA